jgi:DNA-binding response OmpR family regulator
MARQAGRIFLAEPELPFGRVTEALLSKAGYVCEYVTDARAAMAALEVQSYDLLIADIDMPGTRS